jgi:hypothetical protein
MSATTTSASAMSRKTRRAGGSLRDVRGSFPAGFAFDGFPVYIFVIEPVAVTRIGFELAPQLLKRKTVGNALPVLVHPFGDVADQSPKLLQHIGELRQCILPARIGGRRHGSN